VTAHGAEYAGHPSRDEPVADQPPVADAEAGGPGAHTPLPHELVGQRTGPGPRRNGLIVVGAGLTALAAVIAVIAISKSSAPSPTSSNSPKASANSAKASASRLSYDQLRPGDCVQVPSINTINAWPNFFTVVPCVQQHTGEVFYAGDIWPRSIAYPGDSATDKQADARCGSAFTGYDGISADQSAFTYEWDLPDTTSWLSGDRSVQCIAYDPSGAPMDSSIKGSSK
jgi:hypothetical protein